MLGYDIPSSFKGVGRCEGKKIRFWRHHYSNYCEWGFLSTMLRLHTPKSRWKFIDSEKIHAEAVLENGWARVARW